MAKNEHTVIRGGTIAAILLIITQWLLLFSACTVRLANAGIEDPQTVMLWAAEHLMPVFLGMMVVVGIVAAGISSASTFLSLIGFALVNDMLNVKDEKMRLLISRWSMLIISTTVLILNMFKPPMVFWITQFGGSIAASSFLAVSLCSVWWPRFTKKGAFLGVLFGFGGAVITRTITIVGGITMPMPLDPFWVGVYGSIIGVLYGTFTTQVTEKEKKEFALLHVIPESEMIEKDVRITRKYTLAGAFLGVVFASFLIIFWAHPWSQAVAM